MALSLTVLPGSPKRVQLLADGEPVKKVSCSIVSEADLRSLPEEGALERLHALEVKGGIRYAVALLSRRSAHSKALEQALRRHCLELEVIAEIITYCTQQGWLDDGAWIERHAEVWQAKGKSPLAIKAYLRSKGISADLVLDEQSALAALVKRKFPQLLQPNLPYPERARILRTLQRRGFSLSAIQQLLRTSKGSPI
jgi:regulatory protein